MDDASTVNVVYDGITHHHSDKREEENYKYCSVMIQIYVSAVLVHSESVCGPTEHVESDQVTIR